jgi:hypothetical protein
MAPSGPSEIPIASVCWNMYAEKADSVAAPQLTKGCDALLALALAGTLFWRNEIGEQRSLADPGFRTGGDQGQRLFLRQLA